MHFHYSLEARLFHYFDQGQVQLLMHMIQCSIWVRPRCFMIKPGQTYLTRTKCDPVDPDDSTQFQPCTTVIL